MGKIGFCFIFFIFFFYGFFLGSETDFSEVSFWWKIAVYVLIGAGIFLGFVIRGIWSGFMVKRSEQKIHDELLNHIMHAPPSFYFVSL
jgi:hypothetical protein